MATKNSRHTIEEIDLQIDRAKDGSVVTENADKIAQIIEDNTAEVVTPDGTLPVSGMAVSNKLSTKADKAGFIEADSWENKSVSYTGEVTEDAGRRLVCIPIKKGETAVCITGVDSSRAAMSYAAVKDATTVTMVMRGTGVSGSVFAYHALEDGYVYMLFGGSGAAMYKVHTPSIAERAGIKDIFKGCNLLNGYVGSDYEDATLWGSGFLNASNGVSSSTSYVYSRDYIPVVAGDYLSRLNFDSNARMVVYDASKSPIQYLSEGNATISKTRTFDANAAYVRISVLKSQPSSLLSLVYQGEDVVKEELPRVTEIANSLAIAKHQMSAIDNNLLTEAGLLDSSIWSIENESGEYGIENYGKEDVCYRINLPRLPKKLHIAVDVRCTRALAANSSVNQKIINVFGKLSFVAKTMSPIYNNGDYYRSQYIGLVGNGSLSNVVSGATTPCLRGDTLLCVSPKVDSSLIEGYEMRIGSLGIDVRDASDVIVESIAIPTYMSLSEVVDEINAKSQWITASSRNTIDKVYGDVLQSDNYWLPMTTSIDGVVDNVTHWIDGVYDDKWHTIEMIVDLNNRSAYASFDGITTGMVEFNEPTTNVISIGGTSGVSDYRLTPLQFRNLRIDLNSYGDAELISYPGVVSGNQVQLISSRNPRLIIFEGHGVEDVEEGDVTPGGLTTSTDRLVYLFGYLDKMGYRPVSWNDVKFWKLNGTPLPKRCYVCMFDDFELHNYLDSEIRLPFEAYGVKAGLAVLTNHQRDEVISIDGNEWQVGSAIDTIVREGWHPVSHTPNHTTLDKVKPSQALATFKEWALGAQRLGIYDDILVYPEGKLSATSRNALEYSSFRLGIMVEQNAYPCRARSSYKMPRISISNHTVEWLKERIV